MNPIIFTSAGKYFNLKHPMLSHIDINTIAHALSHICRFTGHTSEFYSVAQHSYHASFLVPTEYALEALLHDAAEAYIGDVATPLKNLLDDYAAIEKKVEQAVFAYFELSLPLSIFTKQADQIMLATEKRDLLPPSPDDWFAGTGIEPTEQKIVPVSSNVAKRLFLERYTHLTRIDVDAEAIEA
jgi:hypothetical protein